MPCRPCALSELAASLSGAKEVQILQVRPLTFAHAIEGKASRQQMEMALGPRQLWPWARHATTAHRHEESLHTRPMYACQLLELMRWLGDAECERPSG